MKQAAALDPAQSAFRLPRLRFGGIPIAILFVLIVFLTAYPTLLVLVSSFRVSRPGDPAVWGLSSWVQAFGDASVLRALANTFMLAILRITLATVLSIVFAWIVTRTDTPFRGAIEFVLWLGFFLPQLPMVLGWIMLLDPQFGLLNVALKQVLHLSAMPFSIYSFGGIVWAQLAFSTSIRFLLITPAFRTMDAVLEEASRVSGATTFTTLRRVTVPVLAPAILASFALGFIRSLQSFETEMVLGIPVNIYVFSTKIYDFIHWSPPKYGAATALSSVFLLAIFVMVWLQRIGLRNRQFTTVSGKGFSTRPTRLGRWRWVTLGCCLLWIAVMILLPLAFLIMGTFMRLFGFFNVQHVWTLRHWRSAFDDPVFLGSLRNTLALGIGAGLGGALLCSLISYVVIRVRFAGRGLMDFLSWLPWSLPGVLLGLAMLWAFVGVPGLRLLYGTIWLLILAILIAQMPLGTQIFKASLQQVSHDLEESAWASGASRLRTVRSVLAPLLMPTSVTVALIIFIEAVRDIPTIVFLVSSGSRTLSILMLDYIAAAELEKAVVLGVFITALILLAAGVGRLFLGMRLAPVSRAG